MMNKAVWLAGIACTATVSYPAFSSAQESEPVKEVEQTVTTKKVSEQKWGLAAVSRTASIPFENEIGDDSVTTFIPMMFFENDYFFLDGIEGGGFLYKEKGSPYELSVLTRMRFVDIPASIQNEYEGDTADIGMRLRYHIDETWQADLEFMSDSNFDWHSNARIEANYEFGDWELSPHANLRYKSSDFNSTYYAFEQYTNDRIGAGFDATVGLGARYHVFSNLYLLGSANVTRLDDNAYDYEGVKERYQGELYLGFGFFNDKAKAPKSELSNPRYIRIAHGWATPSNIGDIFKLNSEKDEFNNQLTSFFYGHPLTDELFGWPIDIYLTPGVVHHWSSDVQSSSTEYVAAIKAYYTFNWPTKWRFGVAEGLSYIDKVTYIEATEMEEKNKVPSNLLNYLDFSFDVNVGDLFNQNDLNNMWVGYSLHHRSAIFEKASQYGRIKGGSNYNTIYVQFDF
ncbi:MipA/OmpV family protein [Vibrio sp. SCSIO 43135]|uniref:MipA/OmpV family protein n=1 Tax=Vibrio sp. SCSIO 43135 TaxID=2819096 RepID=UPI00207594E4|nr:MipA/OmpV family protein [Vibrio sp. SCSIO 43135]USD42298.1 MipA/OmpV family protein [Vibrio sp. SCSIO 43135]